MNHNQPLRSAHAADAHGHAPGGFDETNPHGTAAGHHAHKHVIVSAFTNRVVLAVLLTFTALTVGLANAEVWIQQYFDIHFPTWVNVSVAMSIATVKAALVVMYFMQLRYDNPINTVIFLFSLFAFALFLGFTTIDLDNRGKVYAYKGGEVQVGGNRIVGAKTLDKPIVQQRREEFLKSVLAGDQAKFDAMKAELFHHRQNYHPRVEHSVSTSGTSRPRGGTTPGLFEAKAPADDGHGHGADHKHDSNSATKPASGSGH
ncbi:MAG: cytochrome C oxidase subunit IV family protein [Planctomycetes bacterium]|nr:cytochrome C oxidase subunit IV family protein [Planctomycetota bacterium]